MRESKFAFIMRGVPGSGKSTTAKRLAGNDGIIHSVDSFHKDEMGNFLWIDEKIDEYYLKNFESFSDSCQKGYSVVVCDCMNLTNDDYQKYVDVAQEFGYIVSTVSMQHPDPEEAANRNKHYVSKEQISSFLDLWER